MVWFSRSNHHASDIYQANSVLFSSRIPARVAAKPSPASATRGKPTQVAKGTPSQSSSILGPSKLATSQTGASTPTRFTVNTSDLESNDLSQREKYLTARLKERESKYVVCIVDEMID